MLKSNLVNPSQIIASARTEKTLEDVKSRWNIQIRLSNIEAAEEADILFWLLSLMHMGQLLMKLKIAFVPMQ